MRTDDLFRMRADFPMLSDSAYFLLVFILFRIEGSKCVDENGEKFIYLTGNNDPKSFLGYNEYKLRKAKKELYDLGIIKRVVPGMGQNNRYYFNTDLPNFGMTENRNDRNSTSVENRSFRNSHSRPSEIQQSDLPNLGKSPSYIIKTKEKTKGKTKARTASPPSSRSTNDDEYVNPFTALLEEERRKNGKRTDNPSS